MRLFRNLLFCGSCALAIGLAGKASAQSAGLALPPGQIVTGPIVLGQAFCRTTKACVGMIGSPSISNGFDANQYLLNSNPPLVNPLVTPSTLSYTNSTSSPAVVVLTTAPTQYVRFYSGNSILGNFIAGSNMVRGLTPAQVRDILALPGTPTMEAIVQVPAGTCLLVGTAGPILDAQPPASPVGVWGRGGALQEFIIGKSAVPGCGPGSQPVFLSASSFVNGQPIGAYALAYVPRAGAGNAGAVAFALDHALPPPLFSDMDSIYNALDLLNFGDPAALRSALSQLDGEVYADLLSVSIGVSRMFLDAVRAQTHLARTTSARGLRTWISGLGGGGAIYGNGDLHGVSFSGGGVSVGADYRLTPELLAGVALSYMRSSFGLNGASGSGGLDSFAVISYAGYAAGPFYVDGALGYSYNRFGAGRNIVFPGVTRGASANVYDNVFLSRLEAGYRLPFSEQISATPFASFQGIVAAQNSFAENGAGAINLNVAGRTAASAQSTLGAELTYDLPLRLAKPLSFSARAGWMHDYADVRRSVMANFQGALGSNFIVNGARWPRDAAAVGARLSLPVESANIFVRYDGMVASSAAIHSATGGVQIAF